MAHMTFDLMDKGYEIYLCYRDKKIKIEDGMELVGGYCLSKPVYYDESDIIDVFKFGYFNKMLGIEE